MKRILSVLCASLCMLGLLICQAPAVLAADQKDHDCAVFFYGLNSTPEVVTNFIGIQVQAGDGSGDAWVVSDYAATGDSVMHYYAADPTNSKDLVRAELIAGDADSGIAVFRLEQPLAGRSAPALRSLDGLSVGDLLRVAGISRKEDGKQYLSSSPARVAGLEDSGGYSYLTLSDGNEDGLDSVGFRPISVVVDGNGAVVGFYAGGHRAIPSGYLMTGANGIGSLTGGDGPSGKTPDSPSGETPDSPSGKTPGKSSGGESSLLETVQTNTDVERLLAQADEARARTRILKVALVAAAVLIAVGIVVFALKRSRKGAGVGTAAQEAAKGRATVPPPTGPQAEPMGKTEYVGARPYGKTEPAAPVLRLVPLPGTPGSARTIPPQGLTLGRSPECDVQFPVDAGGVSGRHCALTLRNGELILSDLGSSYGTLLEDGRKLSSGETAILNKGDRFYLGSRKTGFQIAEP